MAKGDRTAITSYLDPEQKEKFDGIMTHYGAQAAEAIRWMINEKDLEIKGKNTKDAKLDKILERTGHIESKLDMLLLLVWRMESDQPVTLTAEEVQRFKETVAEIFAPATQ